MSIVYSYVLVPLLINLTAPLLPNRVYTDGAISLTYSGKWWITTAFDDVPFCQQADVHCLIVGRDSVDGSPGLTFELERFSGFGIMFMSAEQADEQTWSAIREQDSTARTISHEVRAVDGRVFVERHYTSGQLSALSVYIKDRAGLYRFYAEGPDQLFNQRLMELEEMIDSIHFTDQI